MYALSFRQKLFSIKASEGLTYEETAKRFGIGKTTLVRWHQRLEPLMNRDKSATKVDMSVLKQDIENHPDSYQHERAEQLKVSQAGIWYALKRLGITYKKNSTASSSGSRKTICILPNS